MKMTTTISSSLKVEALGLYNQGYCALEIKEKMGLKHSVRQIQRWVKEYGYSRTVGDAFRLAVSKKRVHYFKSPDSKKRLTVQSKQRFRIFQRDKFKCVYCGNTAREARLQIDHIDDNPLNNVDSNLQVTCEPCNKGKYRNSDKCKEDMLKKNIPIWGVSIG